MGRALFVSQITDRSKAGLDVEPSRSLPPLDGRSIRTQASLLFPSFGKV